MELSPLILQGEEEALQEVFQEKGFLQKTFLQESLLQNFKQNFHKGFVQGFEQGIRNGRRTFIESFFRVQFGVLDEELSKIIEPLVELPSEESVALLLQSSREELLARFGS